MSNWKLRSPDSFPKIFLDATEKGLIFGLSSMPEEKIIIADGLTHAQAIHLADRYRHYRWCIRQHPLHQYHHLETNYNLKVRIHHRDGLYALTLTVKPKVPTDLLERALFSEAHSADY